MLYIGMKLIHNVNKIYLTFLKNRNAIYINLIKLSLVLQNFIAN
jgi:hypothetical protein